MRFLPTVLLPERGDIEGIVATLQPGQWVRFEHRFANATDPLYGVSRFAGVTTIGTIVMDHTRRHFSTVRRFAAEHSIKNNIPCSKSSKTK